jgi:hypothetical protein
VSLHQEGRYNNDLYADYSFTYYQAHAMHTFSFANLVLALWVRFIEIVR